MSPRPHLATRLLTGGLLLALSGLGWTWSQEHLRIVLDESAPRGIYLLDRQGSLSHDTFVVTCLPEEHGSLGRERGYLFAGDCPGRAGELLKRIAALPSDVVDVSEDRVLVGGRLVLPRHRHDRSGRPLPAIPTGRYRVRAGHAWLYSPHPMSWDSRYWGAVPLLSLTPARLLIPLGSS